MEPDGVRHASVVGDTDALTSRRMAPMSRPLAARRLAPAVLAAALTFVALSAGLAPLPAVEVARRSLDSGVQPESEELEHTLKSMPSPGK